MNPASRFSFRILAATGLLAITLLWYLSSGRVTPGPRMTFTADIMPQMFIGLALVLILRDFHSADQKKRLVILIVAGLAIVLSAMGLLGIYASFHAPYGRGPIFEWW